MPPLAILPKKQYDMSQSNPTSQANLTCTDTDSKGVGSDALESTPEDSQATVSEDDRRVLNALRFFYPDRHLNMARVDHSSTLANHFKPTALSCFSESDTSSTESHTVSLDTDLIDADNRRNFVRTGIGTISY